MERRNTVQRDLVLSAVRQLKSHATADEVYAFIVKDHPSIGKGTVYRNLNLLCEAGEIRRVSIPNGPDRFDHCLTVHDHVRCSVCGRVMDITLDVRPDFSHASVDADVAEIFGYELLFSGICTSCAKKKQ